MRTRAGSGLAAVLALGADSAWVGTRPLASKESPIVGLDQQRLIGATETDTICTKLFDVGWPEAPHRVLVNRPGHTKDGPAVPTDLLWQFRSASLLQLTVRWLVTGLLLRLVEQRADRHALAGLLRGRVPVAWCRQSLRG